MAEEEDTRFVNMKVDQRFKKDKNRGLKKGGDKAFQKGNKNKKFGKKAQGKVQDSEEEGSEDGPQLAPIDERFIGADAFSDESMNQYVSEGDSESDGENSSEAETKPSKKGSKKAKASNQGLKRGQFVWDEESSDEGSIDMERVQELIGQDVHLGEEADEEFPDAWSSEEEAAPIVEASTKRLALMNYDWSKITAGDIMIALSSFLPAGGRIEKVAVFPSDFGLRMLEKEEKEGPGDIFKDEDEEETEKQGKREREALPSQWVVGEEEGGAFDREKLRKYEKERLKYYYAVLYFDSASTADQVFESCQGFELEKTGIKLDLRAIPDDLVFPHAPKEVCKEKPAQASELHFLNRALAHTKVGCSWDEPELDNKKNAVLFNDDMVDKIDLEDYIAPGIDEGYREFSDEDEEEMPTTEDIKKKLKAKIAEKSKAKKASKEAKPSKTDKKLKKASKKVEEPEEKESSEEDQDDEQSSEDSEELKAQFLSALTKKSANKDNNNKDPFSDFNKKKQRGGIKISFKNPLEMGGESEGEDENPLGKREYRVEREDRGKKRGREEIGEEEGGDQWVEDGEEIGQKEGLDKAELKNMKFKERMKEKKKQAKLKKEQERDAKRALKEQIANRKSEKAADLELLVEKKKADKGKFNVDYADPRFEGMFDDHDMEIDPTSTQFDKKRHTSLMKARKELKKK